MWREPSNGRKTTTCSLQEMTLPYFTLLYQVCPIVLFFHHQITQMVEKCVPTLLHRTQSKQEDSLVDNKRLGKCSNHKILVSRDGQEDGQRKRSCHRFSWLPSLEWIRRFALLESWRVGGKAGQRHWGKLILQSTAQALLP